MTQGYMKMREDLATRLNDIMEYEQGRQFAFNTAAHLLTGPIASVVQGHYDVIQSHMSDHVETLRRMVVRFLGYCPSARVQDVGTGIPRSGEAGVDYDKELVLWMLEDKYSAHQRYRDAYDVLCPAGDQDELNRWKGALPHAWEVLEHSLRLVMVDIEESIAIFQTIADKPPRFVL